MDTPLTPRLPTALIAPRSAVTPCASERLAHRRPRLVWASGEHFAKPRLSVGSELLRHGWREWAGIGAVHTVEGVEGDGCFGARSAEALQACLEPQGPFEELPIVVCRDASVPALLQAAGGSQADLMLVLVGSPRRPVPGRPAWSFAPHSALPLALPAGVTPGDVAWLAAPEALCLTPWAASPWAFLASARAVGADAVAFYLAALSRVLRRRQALRVWMVVCADGLRLGRRGPGWVDDEVFAASLRWMQQQAADPLVLLWSAEPHAPAGLQLADAARHFGQALYRHRDFR